MDSELDPVLGYIPAIPEPCWVRSWSTWMRSKPCCPVCNEVLRDKLSYRCHYVFEHISEAQSG